MCVAPVCVMQWAGPLPMRSHTSKYSINQLDFLHNFFSSFSFPHIFCALALRRLLLRCCCYCCDFGRDNLALIKVRRRQNTRNKIVLLANINAFIQQQNVTQQFRLLSCSLFFRLVHLLTSARFEVRMCAHTRIPKQLM